jgi:hypothetical protein
VEESGFAQWSPLFLIYTRRLFIALSMPEGSFAWPPLITVLRKINCHQPDNVLPPTSKHQRRVS